MTQAAQARPPQSAATRRPAPWTGPLVAGLCFGLAYGLTQRIVSLNVSELIRFGQGFDVQVFPGTSLESLRLRFGAAASDLRGNLELNELERQKAGSQAQEDKPGLTTQQETALPEPSAGNAAEPADLFGSGAPANAPGGPSRPAVEPPAPDLPPAPSVPSAPSAPPPPPAASRP